MHSSTPLGQSSSTHPSSPWGKPRSSFCVTSTHFLWLLISLGELEVGIGRRASNHQFVNNCVLVVHELHFHLRQDGEDHHLDFYRSGQYRAERG